jgi:hypothetical protein
MSDAVVRSYTAKASGSMTRIAPSALHEQMSRLAMQWADGESLRCEAHFEGRVYSARVVEFAWDWRTGEVYIEWEQV